MLSIHMRYALTCDTCDYEDTVADDTRVYVLAKEHEQANGGHFVLIETLQ